MNSPRFETRSIAAKLSLTPFVFLLLCQPALVFNGVSEASVPWDARQNASVEANPAPSAAQIRSMMMDVVANLHHNDDALEEFERTERVITRKDENSAVEGDQTNRLIPTGTGVTRFEVSREGMPISREAYREHLQFAIRALELAMHPNERENEDFSKFRKRQRERADLVGATLQAFHATWAGRETRGSRTLTKFLLQPNPDFKPTTRLAEVFLHVQAVLWVDESQKQIVRLEGDIISDVSFGGGIVGKLYRGGHFTMEQSEVAPGVWEPTVLTYDLDGRKLFLGFSVHGRTEDTHYHHLGPPQQAVEILRDELNHSEASATQP